MASQGPLSPGTLADDAGVGTLTWANPSNAASSNNSYATITFTAASQVSHYLKATNLGFSIPTGATINGIVVEVERNVFDEAGIALDTRARIVKGGSIGSTEKATGTSVPDTDAYITFGSSSDLWGETWTDSDINGSTFGFAYSSTSSKAATLSVDHIRVTVHYTGVAEFSGWGVPI